MHITRSRFRAPSVALVVLAGIGTAAGQDDSFRCEGRLITSGMSANTLIEHCGRPDDVEVVGVPILAKRLNGSTHQVGTQTIEHWTYGRGAKRFAARVEVEDGIAKHIELQY